MRIAGVDIGGTYVKVGLVDTARGLLDKTSFPTPLSDPQAMAGLIARQVREMDASAVGIGSAGSVRLDTGLVYAGNLDWWGVPLRKLVEERLHMPEKPSRRRMPEFQQAHFFHRGRLLCSKSYSALPRFGTNRPDISAPSSSSSRIFFSIPPA